MDQSLSATKQPNTAIVDLSSYRQQRAERQTLTKAPNDHGQRARLRERLVIRLHELRRAYESYLTTCSQQQTAGSQPFIFAEHSRERLLAFVAPYSEYILTAAVSTVELLNCYGRFQTDLRCFVESELLAGQQQVICLHSVG